MIFPKQIQSDYMKIAHHSQNKTIYQGFHSCEYILVWWKKYILEEKVLYAEKSLNTENEREVLFWGSFKKGHVASPYWLSTVLWWCAHGVLR